MQSINKQITDHIAQKLKTSERILITSHANPDGDAIGSLVALGLALSAMDKKVSLFNESQIPAVYRFLPSVKQVHRRLEDFTIFDMAFILDCGAINRVGSVADDIEKIKTVVNIDHHVTNTGFGHIQLIDPAACATAEVLYRLIKALGVTIGTDIASAIYTGILTDTGSFRFANTNRAAFEIAQEMVGIGVDPSLIAQYMYGTYSIGRIKLLNMALDTIETFEGGKLSLMSVSQKMLDETGTRNEDVDGMINYARGIQNIKVAALIQELNNGNEVSSDSQRRYHVSLRSDGQVDVAAIASAYGGGGHCSAAGFSIKASLADIKAQLAKLAKDM